MKRQKLTPSEFLYGLCFALCFFAFMLTEAFINERCAVILGSGAVNSVYTFGLVCTGFGFLSFSLLRRLCKKKNQGKRRRLSLAFCVLGRLWFCFLQSSRRSSDKFFCSPAADGHISGCVYYNTAMYFAASRYTGRLIGMGMGAAILLQFVVQNLMPQSVAFIISILFSVAFVMYFIMKRRRTGFWKILCPIRRRPGKIQKSAASDRRGGTYESCSRNDRQRADSLQCRKIL